MENIYNKEYKGKKVTIRKEGNHYLTCIGGVGYSLHGTKRRAKQEANAYRRQLGRR
jgi:hypothetical protein